MYKQVLQSGIPQGGINRGFRSREGQTYSYEVYRSAFPFLYVKRDICDDGCHTRTLPVILQPAPLNHICLQIDASSLSPDYVVPFAYLRYQMSTIRQAHCMTKVAYCIKYKQGFTRVVSRMEQILATTKAEKLHQLNVDMGECMEFTRDEFDILRDIVQKRMDAHPQLHLMINIHDDRYIVNACALDCITGSGCCPRTARYRPNSYLEGLNLLGRVYMLMRSELRELVTPNTN